MISSRSIRGDDESGMVGAVAAGVGVTLVATSFYREMNPGVPHGLWAVPCFVVCGLAVWLARHLASHAYLILTPLGLEIFPFFRPAKAMQLVLWQEIVGAETNERWLTLHFNGEKTAGLHLSMRPIVKKRRELLAKAVLGRVCREEI